MTPEYSVVDAVVAAFFPLLVGLTAAAVVSMLFDWVDRALERAGERARKVL